MEEGVAVSGTQLSAATGGVIRSVPVTESFLRFYSNLFAVPKQSCKADFGFTKSEEVS